MVRLLRISAVPIAVLAIVASVMHHRDVLYTSGVCGAWLALIWWARDFDELFYKGWYFGYRVESHTPELMLVLC